MARDPCFVCSGWAMTVSDTNTIQIFLDGNQWCALLGKNIQEGIAAFGTNPKEALGNLVDELQKTSWNWNKESSSSRLSSVYLDLLTQADELLDIAETYMQRKHDHWNWDTYKLKKKFREKLKIYKG